MNPVEGQSAHTEISAPENVRWETVSAQRNYVFNPMPPYRSDTVIRHLGRAAMLVTTQGGAQGHEEFRRKFICSAFHAGYVGRDRGLGQREGIVHWALHR